MKNKKTMELYVGLFMLAGLLTFLILAIKVSGLTTWVGNKGYVVSAEFDNIGGLKVRAPVSIAGVRVGEVKRIFLDPVTFKAQVDIRISNSQNKIPEDTNARILTEGLLGANYIALTPGYDAKYLHNHSKIEETQPALILENLIGQLMFSLTNDKKDKGSTP